MQEKATFLGTVLSSFPEASRASGVLLQKILGVKQPSSYLDPPTVVSRDVVASHHNSDAFGPILASRSWELGFFGAHRKAYVGDGSSWIWTLFKRRFQPYGFVGILDFIHALTYVYAAAMAARTAAEGWPISVRWITGIWQGQASQVIVELAQRQQQLGLPKDEDGGLRRAQTWCSVCSEADWCEEGHRYAGSRKKLAGSRGSALGSVKCGSGKT